MRACFYLEMYRLALYEIRKYFIFVKHGELTSARARRSGNPRQKESRSTVKKYRHSVHVDHVSNWCCKVNSRTREE